MTPQPGDYGVVSTTGGRWYDRAAAKLIRWGTDSPVNHAFIYMGGGQIMEARPGGAGLNKTDAYHGIIWSTAGYTTTQRHSIVMEAQRMAGIPYGWLDIAAIALAQRRTGRLVNSRTWWVRRVNSTRRLICSQLVDLAYRRAGIQLFDDGRLPGLVSPGDLYTLIETGADIEREAA